MTTAGPRDPFQPGNSLAHRVNARVKVALALGYILATALMPTGAWPVLVILMALAATVLILAELPAGSVLARTALALPFALAALPLLFTVAGSPLFSLPWGWTATREGLLRLTFVVSRTWLSVLMAIALTATTPFTAILAALRAWGLPKLLASVVALTWRYLFVLVDEAARLLRARAARSGHTPGTSIGSLGWRARVTGSMAGNLLLRGTDRAERIYSAMAARGYDGEPPVLSERRITTEERAVIVLGLLALTVVTAFGLLFWS